ncbi:MAG: hypothetical protein KKI08_16545 [Armatimonadetes bacterium]|nr:hypothetical protein [Armatimonadota bacterium]
MELTVKVLLDALRGCLEVYGATTPTVVGPVDLADVASMRIEADPRVRPGLYVFAVKDGLHWRPVYSGNTANIRRRIGTINPEGWLQRVAVYGFFAYTALGDRKRKAAEDAVKARFGLA